MPNYDLTNLAVQMALPNNVVMYDDRGEPSVMVRIPKFKCSDVMSGGPATTHPAFIVNGVEKDAVYISKYQNVVYNGRAYSLPGKDPATYVNHDQAWNYCKAKGAGWHLMTNAEWAAIALWCKANGFQPNGNNNYGIDVSETLYRAMPTYMASSTQIGRTATGTGPVSWYHDNTFAGIADLNGNVWEWAAGLRLNEGEIQVLENNDAADWNNSVAADSALWKAVLATDGSLVAPGTAGTVKFDYTAPPPADPEYTGSVNLTSGTIQYTDDGSGYGYKAFEGFPVNANMTVPPILKQLAIHPNDASGYMSDCIWFRNSSEKLALRGGIWYHGAPSGVWALNLTHVRTFSLSAGGFRSAFVL